MHTKHCLSIATVISLALASPLGTASTSKNRRDEADYVHIQKACESLKPNPGEIGWLATASFGIDWAGLADGLTGCGKDGCIIGDGSYESGKTIILLNDACSVLGVTPNIEPLGWGNGFESTVEGRLPDGVWFSIYSKMQTIDAGEYGGIAKPKYMKWQDGVEINVDEDLVCGDFQDHLDGLSVGAYRMCKFPAK